MTNPPPVAVDGNKEEDCIHDVVQQLVQYFHSGYPKDSSWKGGVVVLGVVAAAATVVVVETAEVHEAVW